MPNGHRTAALGLTFFWGIAIFCLFAFLAWVLFRFGKPAETIEDKRMKARVEKREALEKENADKLNRYAWKDPKTGAVQLPVTRAMELTITDLGNKPARASQVKVEEPYPVGLIPPPGADPAVAPGPPPGTNPAGSPAPAAPNTNAPELKNPQ